MPCCPSPFFTLAWEKQGSLPFRRGPEAPAPGSLLGYYGRVIQGPVFLTVRAQPGF